MSDLNYHATEDHLESYVMGHLPETDLEVLEEHLLLCRGCQSRLDETETYVLAMKSALGKAAEGPASDSTSISTSMGDRLRFWISDLRPSFYPALAGGFALVLLGVSTQMPVFHKPVEPLMVRLEAMKGETGSAVANRPLALVLDTRGVPASPHYSLQIVDRLGKRVWDAPAVPGDATLNALVKNPLGSGQYFVRLYGQGQEPLREYGLHIR